MPDKPKTQMLSDDDPFLRRALANQTGQELGTGTLGGKIKVMLLVGGEVKQLMLSEDAAWVLGRFEGPDDYPQGVDLSSYNALEQGVSRYHARIHIQNEQLFITDLNSTNGSYINGDPLPPKTPILLHNGDQLLLGRLAVQVVFR